MAHQFTTSYTKDAIDLFRHYKRLADNAIAQCPDDKLSAEIDPARHVGVRLEIAFRCLTLTPTLPAPSPSAPNPTP